MGGGNNGGGGGRTATHFSVTTATATSLVGATFSIIVTALDASNNVVTSYSGAVQFTSSDPHAAFPGPSTLRNGTGSFSAILNSTGNQTITVIDIATHSITGTSNSISVSGAPSTILLSVSVSSTATAGIAFNLNVTALDPSNANVVTSYSGPVHFTSTDAHAGLPKDALLANGSGTFSVTLNTVGSQIVTVADAVNASITGSSGPITVFGPATHFSVTAPATAIAGTAFDLAVTALDASNAVAITYAGAAHFTSTDGQADLPPDSTIANGMATFPAGLKTAGSRTITVTDAVHSSITGASDSINVSAAAAANPVPLVNQPLSPDATIPGGASFTVTVNGTGFVSGSMVHWNGTPLVTNFVNGSKLTAVVPAADVAGFKTASVTVVSPAPGGGTSNVVYVEATLPTSSVSPGVPAQLTLGSSPTQVITGDFNHDGKIDLATVNHASNNISILLGKGDGTFEPGVDYLAGTSPTSVAIGDFNDDGELDLAVANQSSSNINVLLGNGDGTFQSPKNLSTATNSASIAVGDFNGDGKLDVVTANPDGNDVTVLLGNGDGTFLPALNFATGQYPVSVVVGDFNGDGKLDLAAANKFSNNVSVLLGNGDGTFQPSMDFAGVTPGYSPLPVSVAIADFNGDAKLDLVVANENSNNLSVLLGNGDGTFQPAVNYASGAIPVSMVIGDFNGDGKPDLLVGSGASNRVSLLLGNGDGTFQSALNFDDGSTGFNASRVVAGDFNNDGRLDMAVGNSTSSTISLFLQPELTSGPSAILSPASLTFANQSVGTTSAPQSVTLINYGMTALNISNIAASSNFGASNDCKSSLLPGASCTISVTFSPTPQGSVTGALSVADDAPGSPHTVDLNGASTTVQLTPSSMRFICNIHSPSGCQNNTHTATLTNTGSQTLVISSITTSVLNNVISETNDCPTNLSPGGSCIITVRYFGGDGTGHLFVTDNGGGSPQTISLSAVEF